MPEVLAAFLKLGLTSFGGPVAHIGYMRRELVERRRWLAEAEFGQVLALCQFLPGPASSQLGFSLGLLRAGWGGALCAFIAFTTPSALALFAFAALLPHLAGATGFAAVHGLKLVAVAVVADGLLRMGRLLTPDLPRGALACAAAAIVIAFPSAWIQLAVVLGGALAGLALRASALPLPASALRVPHGVASGAWLLAVFAALLVGLPVAAHAWGGYAAVVEAFYRAGALVFGGGHVVLPLLRETVVAPGWIAESDFLAGYGAAQAIPGPMFSLAAYLGALLPGREGGAAGALVALASIFAPGLLLVAGALPFWRSIAVRPAAARAVAGVNAAVVGLLGAALYDPVWTSAVRGPADAAVAAAGFAFLALWRVSPLVVLLWCVGATLVLA